MSRKIKVVDATEPYKGPKLAVFLESIIDDFRLAGHFVRNDYHSRWDWIPDESHSDEMHRVELSDWKKARRRKVKR